MCSKTLQRREIKRVVPSDLERIAQTHNVQVDSVNKSNRRCRYNALANLSKNAGTKRVFPPLGIEAQCPVNGDVVRPRLCRMVRGNV
jgi:hypothetical protein